MISEDIGDTARYGHSWAPVGRAASRPTNRSERFIHRAGPPVTVSAPTGAAHPTGPWHDSSGWGGAPLVLMAGVFGNITDDDVHRTIQALPPLCAPQATVI